MSARNRDGRIDCALFVRYRPLTAAQRRAVDRYKASQPPINPKGAMSLVDPDFDAVSYDDWMRVPPTVLD